MVVPMVADPPPTAYLPYQDLPVALYTRASYAVTDKSVSDQETVGRQWVADQHAVVFDTYCDNSKSASRFARKAREDFDRLIRDIKTGHIRIIWFWALSRSQRRLGVYASLRDLCREKDVLWVVDGRVYNLADRGDRVALGITAILDEELPDQISENVLRATAANAIAGKPHAHVPYGYRRVYEAKKVVGQEIREDQAAVIRDAAKRFLAGDTLLGIARRLNAAGVSAPEGGQWRPIQVRRLLSRPAYAGKRAHHGIVVADAIWPAILTEEVYYECQRKLADQAERYTRDNTVKHLLSGIAVCWTCKEATRPTGKLDKLYYACPTRCACLRVDWLNEYIEDLTLARLSSQDALEWLAEPPRGGDAASAEKELAGLEEQLEQLYDDAAHNRISNTYGSQVEARLLPQIEAAKARAKVMRVSPVLRDAARPDIRAVWPDYGMPRKREIIRGLYELVAIVPVGRGWNQGFDERRVVTEWRHRGQPAPGA